jgi:hypothetical protein
MKQKQILRIKALIRNTKRALREAEEILRELENENLRDE